MIYTCEYRKYNLIGYIPIRSKNIFGALYKLYLLISPAVNCKTCYFYS